MTFLSNFDASNIFQKNSHKRCLEFTWQNWYITVERFFFFFAFHPMNLLYINKKTNI